MNETRIRQTLETATFTHGLSATYLDHLAAIATEVTFDEGELIFNEGDLGDTLYLVEEGLIAVAIHLPGRGRAQILTVGPSQVLGWSSILEGQRKTASARAVLPTTAVALDTSQLRAACDADPALGYEIMRRLNLILAERLKTTRFQLLDIFAPAA